MMRAGGINPKINFYEAEYCLKGDSLNAKGIENTKAYDLVKRLTDMFHCSSKDKYERCWGNFYLPLKRSGRVISIPFKVMRYKRDFYCYFRHWGTLHVKRGDQNTEEFFRKIFQEAIRFSGLVKKSKGGIVEKTVPYDFRTGKIKGKYILRKLMSPKSKATMLRDYNHHLQQGLQTRCSLNDYLNTASLCYKAAFGKKAAGLKPLEMYKKWADGRDGGMLAVKNWNSAREFMSWYKNKRWAGAHPFEIIFSWRGHGIHLYPPSMYNEWRYALAVTNKAYAEDFIKMSKALIKNNIPFTAHKFEEILDYLTGETYFSVNEYSDDFFFYIPSREHKKEYFKYVDWDDLKIVNAVNKGLARKVE